MAGSDRRLPRSPMCSMGSGLTGMTAWAVLNNGFQVRLTATAAPQQKTRPPHGETDVSEHT